MKTLIRWSATVGLVASTLLSTGLGQMRPVFALPQEEIVKLLSGIPTFILIDDKNFPIGGHCLYKCLYE